MSTGLRFAPGLSEIMFPISNLTPTPYNPNNGDVDAVIASMVKYGVYAPIIANRNTGQILAGHARYAALMELGAQMAPIVWTDHDDTEALGVLMGDNKIARLARMDESLELEALKRLAESDEGLVGTGYTDRDIERLTEKLLKDMEEPLQVNLSGNERLIHEIECPACHHVWVRGQGGDD